MILIFPDPTDPASFLSYSPFLPMYMAHVRPGTHHLSFCPLISFVFYGKLLQASSLRVLLLLLLLPASPCRVTTP